MEKNYVNEIRTFVISNFAVKQNEVDISVPLLKSGIIDSMGIIQIISFLEENYNIVVEDDELIEANFGSIEKMGSYLAQKLK